MVFFFLCLLDTVFKIKQGILYLNSTSLPPLRYIDISFKNLFGNYLAVAFIYLRVSLPGSLDRLPRVPPVSIFFFLSFRHPPFRLSFPFVSVGSAKVGIFSQLPNKIIFIFSAPLFSSNTFSTAPPGAFPSLPDRVAKVTTFSLSPRTISK